MLANLAAGPLPADEVVLEDGTRIVGMIRRLQGERLNVRTSHMGLVKIQWDGIAEIHTDKAFTVELDTGERWSGTLDLVDGLLTVAGETTGVLPFGDVARIDELKRGLWGRLDVEAGGGLSLTRGNDRSTTYSLDAAVDYDRGGNDTRVAVSTRLDEQRRSTDTRRSTLDVGHDFWGAGRRFSLSALGKLEVNESAGLDLRSIVAGTAGYQFVKSSRHRFEGLLGLAWIGEDFVGQPSSESLEPLLGFEYRLNRQGKRLTTSVLAYPDLAGRWFAQLDGNLRLPLTESFDLDLTFFDRFDSSPPVATENHDYGLTLGLGWSK